MRVVVGWPDAVRSHTVIVGAPVSVSQHHTHWSHISWPETKWI